MKKRRAFPALNHHRGLIVAIKLLNGGTRRKNIIIFYFHRESSRSLSGNNIEL